LRTDLVIANPPDLRSILPVRPKIARTTNPEPVIPEKSIELSRVERRIVRDDSYVYQESPAFDVNGEFLPPLSFGMNTYESVEKNTAGSAAKGAYLSVYA
jgi:hypothetical protein